MKKNARAGDPRTKRTHKAQRSGIEVVLPDYSGDDISEALRALTRELIKRGHGKEMFGMAGPYGYGIDFENEVFAMHYDRYAPECDCGGSKPKHKAKCDIATKGQAWLDKRNMIGMVASPLGKGWYTGTDTTYAEQAKWMEANPFPACSCGEERAWLKRHKLQRVPPDGASFFDRVGPAARKFKHTYDCDLSIYGRPHFMHKKSGATVTWYKSIGRQQEQRGFTRAILGECFTSVGANMERSLKAYRKDY